MARERSTTRPTRLARDMPEVLRGLRSLHVCVFHPHDEDGKNLTRQLERIGCQAQAFWPPLADLPVGTDVVFVAVTPDMVDLDFSWCSDRDGPPVIAVIAYENPTIIEAVLRIGARGAVASPVRSFGLLSVLVLAGDINSTIKKQRKRIAQLEAKLAGMRHITEAQDILCRQRGISKEEAYQVIREQAMNKRITAEDVAIAIINANEILSLRR